MTPLFFAALFAASLIASPAPLPLHLEEFRKSSVAELSSLYALSPDAATRPFDIEFVASRPPVIPGSWRMLPRFAAGGALPHENRLVVVEARTGEFPFGNAAQTLRHEISHLLLFRSIGSRAPRWFDEGLALRASGEWEGDRSILSLFFGRAARISLPRIESDFSAGETEARRSYDLARGFVEFLFPESPGLTAFLLQVRERDSFDEAFARRFGTSPEKKFDQWIHGKPILVRLLLTVGSEGTIFFVAALLIPIAAWIVRKRRRQIAESKEPDAPPRLRRPRLPGRLWDDE